MRLSPDCIDFLTNSLGRIEREAIRVLRKTVYEIETFECEVHADGHRSTLFVVGMTLEGFFPCAVEILAISFGVDFFNGRLGSIFGLFCVVGFGRFAVLEEKAKS